VTSSPLVLPEGLAGARIYSEGMCQKDSVLTRVVLHALTERLHRMLKTIPAIERHFDFGGAAFKQDDLVPPDRTCGQKLIRASNLKG